MPDCALIAGFENLTNKPKVPISLFRSAGYGRWNMSGSGLAAGVWPNAPEQSFTDAKIAWRRSGFDSGNELGRLFFKGLGGVDTCHRWAGSKPSLQPSLSESNQAIFTPNHRVVAAA
jgi:hypothetical protein